MTTNDSINISQAGLLSSNGSGVFLGVTLTPTANQTSVSNGSGVSGNPVLSLTSNIYVNGISFDSGTNVLSSYVDNGTWTPVVTGSSTAGVGTYSMQVGTYFKFGNLVIVSFA